MKKNICLFGAVALIFSLSACGGRVQPENPVGELKPENTPINTAVPMATPHPPVTAEPDPLPVIPETSTKPVELLPAPEPTISEMDQERPTDEEVLESYLEAQEAFSWFHGEPLLAAGEPLEVEGKLCQKVEDTRFPDLNSLRNHLKKLFSDEIVDDLLSIENPRYLDFEGELYVVVQEIAEIPESEAELSVLWAAEEFPGCTVHAAVDAVQEGTAEKIYAYPYQKVGDKWVFTQFEPIM